MADDKVKICSTRPQGRERAVTGRAHRGGWCFEENTPLPVPRLLWKPERCQEFSWNDSLPRCEQHTFL